VIITKSNYCRSAEYLKKTEARERQMKGDARLPALRDDLRLLPGPRLEDGTPTWTLHDPVRNRFYRMGWSAFELLARWTLGHADKVIAQVNQETPLQVTSEDIRALKGFLLTHCLLKPRGADVLSVLKSKILREKQGVLTWLLFHYLFVRIPLFHPDRFVESTLPAVRMLFSHPMRRIFSMAAILGLFLTLRQWQAFTHTFLYFFSLRGLFLYGLTLFFVKFAHELGHAYTAKACGIRVPTMGVAILVLWPVLYTDNSEAWKLKDRTSRMSIVLAGTAVELGLAALATLLWNFLPDGPMRSACFLTATVTWVSSLLINLNPFLRFDGYYFLSDFLDVPNLQERAFALGKWHLRKMVPGLNISCPEQFSAGKTRLLIAYAYATWLYRLMLFTAIALMVYHLFFKILGIFLFGAEMVWFVLLPIYREMRVWWQLLRGGLHKAENEGRKGRRVRLGIYLILLSGGLFLLVFPWKSHVTLPALLRPASVFRIYPPYAARIEKVAVQNGQQVRSGDLLFCLNLPELASEEKLAQIRVRMLEEQLRRQFGEDSFSEGCQVIQSRLANAMTRLQGCRERKTQLRIIALSDGMVTDMAEGLRPGVWIQKENFLAILVDQRQMVIEGYLTESRISDIHTGDSGRFHMENRDRTIGCQVREIDMTSTRALKSPYLASVYGGDIPVTIEDGGVLLNQASLFRVLLVPDPGQLTETTLPNQMVRGKVRVRGLPQSLISRAWIRVAGVLVRESGF